MKKLKVIMGILVGIIAIVVICVILAKGQEVDKFSIGKIVNCYGEEITNYQDNKMAFVVQKNEESDEIKVNGKQYAEGVSYGQQEHQQLI